MEVGQEFPRNDMSALKKGPSHDDNDFPACENIPELPFFESHSLEDIRDANTIIDPSRHSVSRILTL